MISNSFWKVRSVFNLVVASVAVLVLASCSSGGGGGDGGSSTPSTAYKVSPGNAMFLVDWSVKNVEGADKAKVEVKEVASTDWVAAGNTSVSVPTVAYSNNGLLVTKASTADIKNETTYDVRVTFLKGDKELATPVVTKVTPQAGLLFPEPVVKLEIPKEGSNAGNLVAQAEGINGLTYKYYWGIGRTISVGTGTESSDGVIRAKDSLTTRQTYSALAVALNSSGERLTEVSGIATYLYSVPPAAPTNVAVAPIEKQNAVKVTWASVPKAQGYKIYVKAVGAVPNGLVVNNVSVPLSTFQNGAEVIENASTPYTLPVEPSKIYNFAVVSVANDIESDTATVKSVFIEKDINKRNVNPGSVIPPSTPEIASVTANGSNALDVEWSYNPVSQTEVCYQRTGSIGNLICALAGADASSYKIEGLKAGTQYGVQLRAVKADGAKSKLSAAVTGTTAAAAKPSAPTLSVSTGAEQIFASWNLINNATSYNLYILPGSKSGLTNTTKTAATKIELRGTSYVFSTDAQHAFAVEAVTDGITSVLSNVEDATPSAKPTDADYTKINPSLSISGTAAELTWNVLNGVLYDVYYSSSPSDFGTKSIKLAGDLNTGKYTHSGRVKGTNVYYQIRTSDKSNTKLDNSAIIGGTIGLDVPSAPVLKDGDVVAKNGGFDVLFGTSTGAVTYNVYVSTAPIVSKKDTYYDSGSSTARSFLGLAEGQKYYVRITAQNEGGESAFSEQKEVTTLSVAAAKPASSPVPNLRPIEGGLVITWPAVSNAKNYKIYLDGKASGETSALGHILANLTEKEYYVQVEACNNNGCANKTVGAYGKPLAKGGRKADVVLTAASWSVAAGSQNAKIEVTFPKTTDTIDSTKVELYVNGAKESSPTFAAATDTEPNKVSATVSEGVKSVYVKLNYKDKDNNAAGFAYSNVITGVAYVEGTVADLKVISTKPYSGAVTLQWNASTKTASSYKLAVGVIGTDGIPAYSDKLIYIPAQTRVVYESTVDSQKVLKYTVRPLANGQKYAIKITEVWNGVDIASAVDTGIEPNANALSAPVFDTDLTKVFNPLTNTGGTLNWGVVANALSYKIYSSTESFGTPINVTGKPAKSVTANSLVITAPAANSTTYYAVAAVDVRGIEGAVSGAEKCLTSVPNGVSGCAAVPNAPAASNEVTGLKVDYSVIEAGKATLTWNKPTSTQKITTTGTAPNEVTTTRDLVGYRVYFKQSGTPVSDAKTLLTDNSVNAGSANVDGANLVKTTVEVKKAGNNYFTVVPVYIAGTDKITAKDKDGNDVQEATTLATAVQGTNYYETDVSNVATYNVPAKAVVSSTVTAKATTTNTDGKSDVVAVALTFGSEDIIAGTTYSIYRSTSKDAEGTQVARLLAAADVKDKTLPSSKIAVAGDSLRAGVTYYYTVAAYNAAGKGEAKQVEVTTLATPVVTKVVEASGGGITITLNKVTNATSYQAKGTADGAEVQKSTDATEPATYDVVLTSAQYGAVTGKHYAKLTVKAKDGTSESSREFYYALKPASLTSATASGTTVTLGDVSAADKIEVHSVSKASDATDAMPTDFAKLGEYTGTDVRSGKLSFDVATLKKYQFKVKYLYNSTKENPLVTFDGKTPVESELSDASSEVTVNGLDAPTNGSWSATEGTITLNWNTVKDADKYTLKYNDGSADVTQDITKVPADTTSLKLNVKVGQAANSTSEIDYSAEGEKVINSKAALGSEVSFSVIAVPAAGTRTDSSPLTIAARTLKVENVNAADSASREQINVSWTGSEATSAVVQVFKYTKDTTNGTYTDVLEATPFRTQTFTQQKDADGVLQPLTSGSISVAGWSFKDKDNADTEQNVPYLFKVQTKYNELATSAVVERATKYERSGVAPVTDVGATFDNSSGGMTVTWKAPQVGGKNVEYIKNYVVTITKTDALKTDNNVETLPTVDVAVVSTQTDYSYVFKTAAPLYAYKFGVSYKTKLDASSSIVNSSELMGAYPAITNAEAKTVGGEVTLTWQLDASTGREPNKFKLHDGDFQDVVLSTATDAEKAGKVVRTGNSYEYKTTVTASGNFFVAANYNKDSIAAGGLSTEIKYTIIKSPTGVVLGSRLPSGYYNVEWSDADKGSGLILEAGYQVLPVGTAPKADYTVASIGESSPGVGTFKAPTVAAGQYIAISFRYDEVGKTSDTFVGAWTGENLKANLASPVVSDVQVYNNIWTPNPTTDLGYMTAKVDFKAGVISKIKVDATGCVELERTNGGFTLPTPNNTCITDITGSVATIKVKAVSGTENTSLNVLKALNGGSSSISGATVTQTVVVYTGKEDTSKVDVKPTVLSIPKILGRKISADSASISWDAVADATGYDVYYKTGSTKTSTSDIFTNVVSKIGATPADDTVKKASTSGTTATLTGLTIDTKFVDVVVIPLIGTVQAVPGVASIELKNNESPLAIADVWFNVGEQNKAKVSFASKGAFDLSGYTLNLKASKGNTPYGEVAVSTAAGNTAVPAPVYLPLNVTTNTTGVKFTLTLTNNSDATDVKAHELTKNVPFVNFANGNNLNVAVDYSANTVTVTPVTVSTTNPKLERCSTINCAAPTVVATTLTNGAIKDSNVTVPSEGLYYRYSGGVEVIAIVKVNPVATLPNVKFSREVELKALLNAPFSISNINQPAIYTAGVRLGEVVNITVADGASEVKVEASISAGLITYTAEVVEEIIGVSNFTFAYDIENQRFNIGATVSGNPDFNYVIEYTHNGISKLLGSVKGQTSSVYALKFDQAKGTDKTTIEKDVFYDGIMYSVSVKTADGVLARKTYQTQDTPTATEGTYASLNNEASVIATGYDNYEVLELNSSTVNAGTRSSATKIGTGNSFTLGTVDANTKTFNYYVVAKATNGKAASVYGTPFTKTISKFDIANLNLKAESTTTGATVTVAGGQHALGGNPKQDSKTALTVSAVTFGNKLSENTTVSTKAPVNGVTYRATKAISKFDIDNVNFSAVSTTNGATVTVTGGSYGLGSNTSNTASNTTLTVANSGTLAISGTSADATVSPASGAVANVTYSAKKAISKFNIGAVEYTSSTTTVGGAQTTEVSATGGTYNLGDAGIVYSSLTVTAPSSFTDGSGNATVSPNFSVARVTYRATKAISKFDIDNVNFSAVSTTNGATVTVTGGSYGLGSNTSNAASNTTLTVANSGALTISGNTADATVSPASGAVANVTYKTTKTIGKFDISAYKFIATNNSTGAQLTVDPSTGSAKVGGKDVIGVSFEPEIKFGNDTTKAVKISTGVGTVAYSANRTIRKFDISSVTYTSKTTSDTAATVTATGGTYDLGSSTGQTATALTVGTVDFSGATRVDATVSTAADGVTYRATQAISKFDVGSVTYASKTTGADAATVTVGGTYSIGNGSATNVSGNLTVNGTNITSFTNNNEANVNLSITPTGSKVTYSADKSISKFDISSVTYTSETTSNTAATVTATGGTYDLGSSTSQDAKALTVGTVDFSGATRVEATVSTAADGVTYSANKAISKFNVGSVTYASKTTGADAATVTVGGTYSIGSGSATNVSGNLTVNGTNITSFTNNSANVSLTKVDNTAGITYSANKTISKFDIDSVNFSAVSTTNGATVTVTGGTYGLGSNTSNTATTLTVANSGALTISGTSADATVSTATVSNVTYSATKSISKFDIGAVNFSAVSTTNGATVTVTGGTYGLGSNTSNTATTLTVANSGALTISGNTADATVSTAAVNGVTYSATKSIKKLDISNATITPVYTGTSATVTLTGTVNLGGTSVTANLSASNTAVGTQNQITLTTLPGNVYVTHRDSNVAYFSVARVIPALTAKVGAATVNIGNGPSGQFHLYDQAYYFRQVTISGLTKSTTQGTETIGDLSIEKGACRVTPTGNSITVLDGFNAGSFTWVGTVCVWSTLGAGTPSVTYDKKEVTIGTLRILDTAYQYDTAGNIFSIIKANDIKIGTKGLTTADVYLSNSDTAASGSQSYVMGDNDSVNLFVKDTITDTGITFNYNFRVRPATNSGQLTGISH